MNWKKIAISLAAVSMGLAQSPKFDVASIKRNTSGERRVGIGGSSPDKFQASNVWLRFLIQWAWNVKGYQMEGGPGWAGSERYDISATKDRAADLEQTKLMLQALLEDRFQLMLHRATKESQVYELVAAKGGIKLQASKDGSCVAPPAALPSPGRDPTRDCGFMAMSPRSVAGTAIKMEQLITALSNTLQRTVVDKTGFIGTFDVHVEWTADQSTPGFVAPGLPPTPQGAPDPDSRSIFTAVQEQLGLKLESAKGPVEFLVIDRLERPSEN